MKRPSRMRTNDNPTNMDSSAFEVYSVNSDSIDSPYGKRLSSNGLVSQRYNRTVKFTIPDKDKLKLKKINKTNLVNGLKSNSTDINEDAEECPGDLYDLTRRRMSAPELPPIANTGKTSTLVSNGLLTPRSNTFHRFSLRTGRKSIHSDSSVNGYKHNSQSRTSSSSSQQSKGRVLSAGTDRRANRQVLTADLTKNIQQISGVKEDGVAMRNGSSTAMTQRCTSVGMTRQKSKYSLKETTSTPRTIPKSRSDAQIAPRRRSIDGIIDLPRNGSDKSLTDSKKNAKNSQNNKITSQKYRLNGMRHYASSNALNIKDERRNEDDETYAVDSDTDSEKDQRVIDWIIGVNEVAEPPEEPQIEHTDEPPQRDTAIRIVYDGDS